MKRQGYGDKENPRARKKSKTKETKVEQEGCSFEALVESIKTRDTEQGLILLAQMSALDV